MKKVLVASLAAALAAGVTLSAPGAEAAPKTRAAVDKAASGETLVPTKDELANPAEDKRRALRQEALTKVLKGTKTPVRRGDSTVVKLGSGKNAQFAELERQTVDRVFVILAEFGDTRHPSYPDVDTNAGIPGR